MGAGVRQKLRFVKPHSGAGLDSWFYILFLVLYLELGSLIISHNLHSRGLQKAAGRKLKS